MEIVLESRQCVICVKGFKCLNHSVRKSCSDYCEEQFNPNGKVNKKKKRGLQYDSGGKVINDDGRDKEIVSYLHYKKKKKKKKKKIK